MTLPLLRLLKAGPPPPRVVLLPDAMFFTRSLPVDAGATPADVAAQVELALETLSPFPPAQLYHGFFWPPGAERVLVFAAYRRRFSTEQTAAWENAELVIPAFAALLGGTVQPGTAVVIPSAEGLTALYWEQGPVPVRVAFRPVDPQAPEAELVLARGELLREAFDSRAVVLAAAPEPESSLNEREFVFRAEAFRSRIPLAVAHALDVRDKSALAGLRRARARDLLLWRTFLALVGVLVLLGIGELALFANGLWQQTRRAQADAQRPVVERIMSAQSLTTRINELSSKRLLPLEMITFVVGKKPADVTLVRTSSVGLYGLTVEATTPNPASVSAFRTALSSDPGLEKVDVLDQRARDNVTNFSFALTFRPGTIKPATQ
ncbi:hypothetical protein [Opitutus terrae]|uniref:Fimbrial assembly family protein n=1 Tax=Opitutus terrae (strain DSM 11246 / JCM 15787 / PB90-1) TaxID=452637 RepID=B1ZTV9_OPITP|nr:hypothetical protein [Opitutus terrae]ACB74892.1 hypothetical protein Oter_1608 [Opitutus terrae PB90-1]